MTVQDANFGLWIIGIISAAALLASAFIAFMEFFVSITGNAGRHTAGLSFPMGYAASPGYLSLENHEMALPAVMAICMNVCLQCADQRADKGRCPAVCGLASENIRLIGALQAS